MVLVYESFTQISRDVNQKKPKSYQLTTAVHTHKKNIRNRQKCPMDRGGHSEVKKI